MSTVWLHVPWILIGISPYLFDFVIWEVLGGRFTSFQMDDLPAEIHSIGDVLILTGAVWMWRRSLKRLSRLGGIETAGDFRLRGPASVVAVIPLGLITIKVTSELLMWFMDTCFPGWA